MMSSLKLEHVDGIAVITIDLANEPVNKVTAGLRAEFGEMFGLLDGDTSIRGVVLHSAKPDTWLAGADIDEFLALNTATEAEALSRGGQELLSRLEAMKIPVVAAIHGACLGGGLETALACRYRIVTDHPKTILALPETQLGLIPGAGGTQRLPRLIGLQRALDMILTGRNVRAKKAYQMGLADEIVHPAILLEVAVDRARKLADKTLGARRTPKDRGAAGTLLENNPLGRAVVFRKAREGVMSKTHGHYPAPLAALEAVRTGYEKGRDAGFREEARLFGEMAMTPESRQLIFLFFATTALKKDPGVDAPAPEPLPVETLGVLGAGFMGAGIAAIAVQQGTPVRLKDTDTARIAKGVAAVSAVLRERLKKKQITKLQYEDQLLLAGGTTEYSGFQKATLVIEAVFEDLSLKQRVLHEVEPLLARDAIYASNTSTIPIARIAEAASKPERVLGLHFFSPVPVMKLVEIVVGLDTSEETVTRADAFAAQLGKTPIHTKDRSGFIVNFLLVPYLMAAVRMYEDGFASREDIDEGMKQGCGHPMGPLTLCDFIGLDVLYSVCESLYEEFKRDEYAPPPLMKRMVQSGHLGRKAGRGFYEY
jgi:3-hydroxyacyl-CoA dehydrogenase/enoyl-CoA hydratase/3-hydroxybutyryl-CoA epimerase